MLEITIVDSLISGRVLIMPGKTRPAWTTENRSATGRNVALEGARPMQDHELAAVAGTMDGAAKLLRQMCGVAIEGDCE